MVFKKVLSLFFAIVCFCSMYSIESYAVEMSTHEGNELVSEYTIGRNPISAMSINQGVASCTSKIDGFDCVQISVTQTLQKYSGWFWSWDDVSGATTNKRYPL